MQPRHLLALGSMSTGQAGIFLSGKIIGGHEARPHSRPYMAFLEIQISGKTFICGGFLVRTNFVLTAAHCWGSSIKVVLGAHNVQEKERTQQVILVRNYTRHPDYNPKTCANDIMLLELTRKAQLGPAVGLLGLPRWRELVMPGTVCSVAGWGRLGVNGRFSTKLQETDLQVQRDEQCISRYSYYNCTTQLCAGSPAKNSFSGDSGSPLVCEDVAQGIVSFGKLDGSPPNVYTRISSFLPWIRKVMR
uniref:Peptidase S1 domain-containing protein n=1 Tax=Catagonus wagneri TaxID=51154 RepID=A0A8C3XDS7_9CETA